MKVILTFIAIILFIQFMEAHTQPCTFYANRASALVPARCFNNFNSSGASNGK